MILKCILYILHLVNFFGYYDLWNVGKYFNVKWVHTRVFHGILQCKWKTFNVLSAWICLQNHSKIQIFWFFLNSFSVHLPDLIRSTEWLSWIHISYNTLVRSRQLKRMLHTFLEYTAFMFLVKCVHRHDNMSMRRRGSVSVCRP